MLIIPDILSADEVLIMKQHWAEHHEQAYINMIQDDGLLIDHRLLIHFTPHFTTQLSGIIDRTIDQTFDTDKIVSRWAAIQRQTNPHGAHVDDFGLEQQQADPTLRMYTYIVALDTVPEFKVIVWKERAASNDEMISMLPALPSRKVRRTSDLSNREDLEHVCKVRPDDLPYDISLGDTLALDGIFQYRSGWACLFDGKQIHTTSNWRKYGQYTHRDLLQIHVLTHEQRDF